MAFEIPEVKPDTLEEIFTDKIRYLDMTLFNIYHFDEMIIDERKYLFRLSTKEDLMTVICHIKGQHYLLVSVFTSMDHKRRLREIHDYIIEHESSPSFPHVYYLAYIRPHLHNPKESSQPSAPVSQQTQLPPINNGSESQISQPPPVPPL
ncbi:hypothetical protein Ciccas_008369 [Cichlidogyrus casuarinus]|uniref:Uncharacterized protein n=1 Tax=Cichlidogyrus casuarinus TaxID=1844966 RepID=A0ABD2Q2S0_9PLAT